MEIVAATITGVHSCYYWVHLLYVCLHFFLTLIVFMNMMISSMYSYDGSLSRGLSWKCWQKRTQNCRQLQTNQYVASFMPLPSPKVLRNISLCRDKVATGFVFRCNGRFKIHIDFMIQDPKNSRRAWNCRAQKNCAQEWADIKFCGAANSKWIERSRKGRR